MVRNYIMEKTGLEYTSESADIDELQFDHLDINERVVEIARAKAKKISASHPDAFIIAADTLTQNPNTGQVFRKPNNLEEQKVQALKTAGQPVRIISGVSIFHKGKEIEAAISESVVTYQDFNEQTLERLMKNDNPTVRSSILGMFFDAAGFTLVEKVEGSYTGAFGLPMEIVYPHLRDVN